MKEKKGSIYMIYNVKFEDEKSNKSRKLDIKNFDSQVVQCSEYTTEIYVIQNMYLIYIKYT